MALLPLDIWSLVKATGLMLTALAFILTLYAVYNIFLHPLRNVPGPWRTAAIPGARIIYNIRKDLPGELLRLHEQYGPVVRFETNFVSVADPNAARTIYSTHAFHKAPVYRSFDLPNESTFSTTDPEFSKKRKRVIGPVFGAINIAQMEPLIHEIGPQMIANRLRAHHHRAASASHDDKAAFVDVDLYSTFYEMTFNVIGRLSFGETFEITTEDSDIGSVRTVQLIKKVDRSLALQFLIPKVLHKPLRDIVGFKPFVVTKELNEYAEARINDKLQLQMQVVDSDGGDGSASEKPASASASASGTKDLLQLMIESVDPETGERLSFSELATESQNFLFVGCDTTSNTMTWVFDQLFQHPDVMAKVEAEILAAFPDPAERIAYRDAKDNLPYLDAVILEAIRVRSIVGGLLPRVVPKGGRVIHGYNLPAGTVVGTSPHVMHNYSQLWDEPLQFRPERFIEGADGATAETVAQRRQNVTPFGIGVRSCIGRQLAVVEYTVGIATLIQQFVIRPPESPYVPLVPEFVATVRPASKALIAKIRPRSI